MAEVSRLEAKIIAMAVIFVVMFVCGLLPIWVAKWVKDKGAKGALVISVLRCFGGGVFFGAYLLHSAPDVRFVLENAWLIPSGITYPMSELFTGCGFFFIMFLEQFIGYWSLRHTRKVKVVLVSNAAQAEGDIRVQVYNGDANEAFDNPADVKVVESTERDCEKVLPDVGQNQDQVAKEGSIASDNGERGHHQRVQAVVIVDDKVKDKNATNAFDSRFRSVSNGSAQFGHGHSHLAALGLQPRVVEDDLMSVASSRKTQHLNTTNSQNIVRTIVFIVAMSFDCIFEGMAMGLKTTTLAVFNLFIAIISHEFIMAFCLGLELTQFYGAAIVALGSFLYALTIPIGVSIGILIYETQENPSVATEITNGVLQSLSAGTFIYVSLLGILAYEMGSKTSFIRMLAVIVGFVFMGGMACISPQDPTDVATTVYSYATTLMYTS